MCVAGSNFSITAQTRAEVRGHVANHGLQTHDDNLTVLSIWLLNRSITQVQEVKDCCLYWQANGYRFLRQTGMLTMSCLPPGTKISNDTCIHENRIQDR